MNLKKAKRELKQILSDMDVPERRHDDIGWLNRNMHIRNSEHPKFGLAQKLLRIITKKNKFEW